MKRTLRLWLLALITFCSSFSASAITVYVSPNGNDVTGNGTAGNPYKTFTKAFSVAGNPGDTVRLLAGTWWLDAPVTVPAGVHLIGETTGISRLRTTALMDHRAGSATGNDFPWAVVRIVEQTNNTRQVISRIHIDGKAKIGADSIKSAWVGILVKDRDKVDISYVTVRNTYFSGILFWDTDENTLTHATLTNTAWGSTGWHSGSITMGRVSNTVIDDVTVSEGVSGTTNWGYGMKAYFSTPATLENVTVRNSTFTCNPVGFFVENGNPLPNIAFEWHEAKAINCEISNNTFYNNLSLVNAYSPNGPGVKSVRVHGNKFFKQAGDNGYYAIELTENNAEIDHNFFKGGKYPIAHWYLNGASAASTGWEVHHNVFTEIEGQTEGIIRLKNTLTNSRFVHNTFHIISSAFDCVFKVDQSNISITGLNIQNNIFTKSSGTTAVTQLSGSNVTVSSNDFSYNALVNVTVNSTMVIPYNNITPVSAGLIGSGAQPSPYFSLQSNSACINAGRNDVGYPYNSCAADIGAFESEVACPGGGAQDVTIDFSTQPSGFGDIDNNQYNDVAGVDVTFGTGFKYYDATVNGYLGGPDHSASADNKMALIQGSTVTITFDEAVQVPSLWMSTLTYGSVPGTATGKLGGVTQWTRNVTVYSTWYQVVDGVSKDIDEIVFTNANNFAIDDLRIVNEGGGGGRKSALVAEESVLVEEVSASSLVYPNPVSSGETLMINGSNIHRATLIDVSGRPLISSDVNDNVLEMPTVGLRGLYLLRLEGREVRTVKVLVR